ncbi:MAG TPA: hypothetical protein PLQ56_22300 [Aggregatilineales bacterium]|nr:hypothetical protein [Aggregatilineales bacterium]
MKQNRPFMIVLLAVVLRLINLSTLEQAQIVLQHTPMLTRSNTLLLHEAIFIICAAKSRLHPQLSHQLDRIRMDFLRINQAGKIPFYQMCRE